MGCFSFMCKECDKGIRSDSFSGEDVKLFLLKDGEVIQEMEGQYDSYGRVFKEAKDNRDFHTEEEQSIQWVIPWKDVCDLMCGTNPTSGIAAIHTKCFKGTIPRIRSMDDPNQGWGEYEEEE